MCRFATALFASVASIVPVLAQPITGFGSAELDTFILQKMHQARLPGLSVLVVKDDEVVWAKAYGFADIDAPRPVTSDTPFYLASISKTFTATAVMQLWEQGLIGLDDDINVYLPFSIRNPVFPSTPITFRMLLSHGSRMGRRDGSIPYTPGQDCPISLPDFLTSFLVPGGSLYNAGSFLPFPPGAAHSYSNVGYALLGYLVERVSGLTLEQYCQQNIFGPLGMINTSWRKAGYPMFTTQPADMYLFNIASQTYTERGFGGWGAYPAATLTTSANQLAKWLILHMNGGTYQGVQILQPQTVQLMQTPVFSDGVHYGYGLGFELPLKIVQAPVPHIGHGGSFPGTATLMGYRPSSRVGIIMMANGGVQADLPNVEFNIYSDLWVNGWADAAYLFIHNRLIAEGEALP